MQFISPTIYYSLFFFSSVEKNNILQSSVAYLVFSNTLFLSQKSRLPLPNCFQFAPHLRDSFYRNRISPRASCRTTVRQQVVCTLYLAIWSSPNLASFSFSLPCLSLQHSDPPVLLSFFLFLQKPLPIKERRLGFGNSTTVWPSPFLGKFQLLKKHYLNKRK